MSSVCHFFGWIIKVHCTSVNGKMVALNLDADFYMRRAVLAQRLAVNGPVPVRVTEILCRSQLTPSVLPLLQSGLAVLCFSVNFLFLNPFILSLGCSLEFIALD